MEHGIPSTRAGGDRWSADTAQPVQRAQLGDQVATIIRDMVLARRIAPGERIVQAEWAKRLGVSRMPVRDAIGRLCAEGTLIMDVQSGCAFAAEVSFEDLADAYKVNATVASLCARRAAERIADAELDDLSRLHDEFVAAVERQDTEAAKRLNNTWHREINMAANSPRLLAFVRLARNAIPHATYEVAEWPTRAIQDHAAIMEALRAHNADRAADLMLQHVEAGSEAMMSQIAALTASQPEGVAAAAAER